MIKRQPQDLLRAQADLRDPGEAVDEVFSAGPEHLGADDAAGLAIRVDADQPRVLSHDPRSALIRVGDLADLQLGGIHVRESRPDDGHLGIRERHRQRRSPDRRRDVRENRAALLPAMRPSSSASCSSGR